MAEAVTIVKLIPDPGYYVPPPPLIEVPNGVTLTLSHEEASVLAAICAHISGSPDGPRGYVNKIQKALHDAGYPWIVGLSYTYHKQMGSPSGIYFR